MAGDLCLIFHGHLPFVRHPEHPHFLEEHWFFEALTETYLPMLEIWEGWSRDGIPARVSVSLSPTLISQMADPLLLERYLSYLDRLIALAERECELYASRHPFQALARMYLDRFQALRTRIRSAYGGDLIEPFRRLEKSGRIELMTTAATHAFLPLHLQHAPTVRTQIRVGIETFARFFGHAPAGFWLPECGYDPALETDLAEAGCRFFFIETHGMVYADPKPPNGVYAPVGRPGGLSVFGRDPESSNQVWNAETGYPGHPDYREYYRDLGSELDDETTRRYLHPDGLRIRTGIKYYRITSASDSKEPYVPDRAAARARIHAEDFLDHRERQMEDLGSQTDRPPLIVTPFDLELFGHWWYEGPIWLDHLVRRAAARSPAIGIITPSDYLGRYPPSPPARPAASSWGVRGYNEVWLNPKNDWIWPLLYRGARALSLRIRDHPSARGVLRRALNQALRELLLAQSSDWPFMLKTGRHAEYAAERIRGHIEAVFGLTDEIGAEAINEERLSALEQRNNLFPFLDYRVFRWKDGSRDEEELPETAAGASPKKGGGPSPRRAHKARHNPVRNVPRKNRPPSRSS